MKFSAVKLDKKKKNASTVALQNMHEILVPSWLLGSAPSNALCVNHNDSENLFWKIINSTESHQDGEET